MQKILRAALLLPAAALPAHAGTIHLQGAFRGEAGAATQVQGEVFAVLDTTSRTLTYRLEENGLSGAPQAIHLHGPGLHGETETRYALLPGAYSSNESGVLHLTAEQLAHVRAGRGYIEIHTTLYPKGEARATLTTGPVPR